MAFARNWCVGVTVESDPSETDPGSGTGVHQPFQVFFHDPVEDGDYPPGTKHSQKGADVDPYDTVNKYKGHNGCQNDAGDVNDVLRQSEFQTTDIRNDLNNPVCRVGNEPHIERHGSSDSYTDNGKDQQGDSQQQLAGWSWKESGKEIHRPGEHQTERQLKKIQDEDLFPLLRLHILSGVQDDLRNNT